MKISAKTLYPSLNKKMLKALQNSFQKTSDKYIVVSCNGTEYFATQEQADAARVKLKQNSVFATVHHVLDVQF